MTKLVDTTRLQDLGLAHLDVVLEETFGVAPAAVFVNALQPETIGDLAKQTRQPVADVIRRLETIKNLEVDAEIDAAALQVLFVSGTSPILVDVREEWEFEICRLKGSLLLANMSFPDLLPRLKVAPDPGVVTICHHGVRSFSAALYLRQKGVRNVRSLAGGLNHWARVIDREMATY